MEVYMFFLMFLFLLGGGGEMVVEVYMFFLMFLFLLGGGDGCGGVHVLFNVSVTDEDHIF